MKIEFLLCGSPTDAFYSQTGMFRLALDSLGGIYRQARLVLCIGDGEVAAVPARWRPHLRDVEVLGMPRTTARESISGGMFRFEVLDAGCDLSLLCDADTLPLAPLDPAALEHMVERPAIRGVIAHFPPPFAATGRLRRCQSPRDVWQVLARAVLRRPLPLDHRHTLTPEPTACPFYVNYGVVIGDFGTLRALYDQLRVVQPATRRFLDNQFHAQVALTLACEAAGLATEALPMRYNFPNDPLADEMHAGELEQVKVMHYLRTEAFDRHRIFASPAEFGAFLRLELSGSNRVFQDRVREITAGVYPFE